MLKTVSSITNALDALNYKGTWNASTNTPALASGAGTKGDYYVVSVAGSTTLDGISNWGVGDWATFNGAVWQRVEGGADLNGVNLSVSGTSTLSGLTGSTALALDANKNVVSVANTGTGNNVLATSPSLTTPRVITGINDTNGNDLLKVTATASAVNELTLSNAATGGSPTLSATGDDTNINIGLLPKGTGRLDLVGGGSRTMRIGSSLNGGSGDEFANLEFYWGDPDAAEVKAKIYAKNVGNIGPGGGGAADLLVGTTPAFGVITERLRYQSDGIVRPGADNTQNFGTASFRWATIFAGNGTINTSDREQKTDIESIEEAETRVANRIKLLFKKFRMKDAVSSKGESARIHFGVIAQDVVEAFSAEGLDATKYGLLCKDVWRELDGVPVPVNDQNMFVEQFWTVDGNRIAAEDGTDQMPEGAVLNEVLHETTEKIRYGIRYEELLCFVIASI